MGNLWQGRQEEKQVTRVTCMLARMMRMSLDVDKEYGDDVDKDDTDEADKAGSK